MIHDLTDNIHACTPSLTFLTPSIFYGTVEIFFPIVHLQSFTFAWAIYLLHSTIHTQIDCVVLNHLWNSNVSPLLACASLRRRSRFGDNLYTTSRSLTQIQTLVWRWRLLQWALWLVGSYFSERCNMKWLWSGWPQCFGRDLGKGVHFSEYVPASNS